MRSQSLFAVVFAATFSLAAGCAAESTDSSLEPGAEPRIEPSIARDGNPDVPLEPPVLVRAAEGFSVSVPQADGARRPSFDDGASVEVGSRPNVYRVGPH